MRADLLGSSSVKKDLGVLVDEKPSMSQQCVLVSKKANDVLGCIRKNIASRLKKTILLVYSDHKRDKELLERVQWRATRMVRGLELLSYEERLQELGVFGLEKRRLREDFINT
ncbi:hypothetical protein HGM15179_012106 [Zosterops borbonicus]|uniref:Uncharacterized protein n=1 Tax=Zosterops borbonicus TaxID=364589 RepID=A0A8K1GBD4_9PASS|nr:hypothetical protein HGM15179_012106 [Zosterops borbonicus]